MAVNPDWRARHPLLDERRLAAEGALMQRTYPQFRLVWNEEALAFRGLLRSNFGSRFQVEIRLPDRYPEAEPRLWVLSPTLPEGTEHRYVDGRICAHAQPFIPHRTTVAAMVSVFAGWLFRFERHRLEGVGWDVPLGPEGTTLGINPDGSIYLRRGGGR